MITYFTTGTVGDAYIILCKLYRHATQEEILCKHYTEHKKSWPAIKEVFSLLPNIRVEFQVSKFNVGKYIHGGFYYAGRPDNLKESEFYPTFESPDLKHFNLPRCYEIIQLESGFRQNRKLGLWAIKKILNSSNLSIIIVGKDSIPISSTKREVIDLRNKTTIRELVAIIGNSQHFYGPQGLLAFMALSQKVPSTIYLRNGGDRRAIWGRIELIPEWNKYYEEMRR